ncbi:Spermidine N(1)-acetyltransferase [Vibrio aerogenes CECT 7868]|uniref:Spermidine N(1)-acetyltransferase n=1 Tax=Vibrio aerogenes CECT 7868 TaxID=1216006 RepID=A0A1M5UUV2_9VIBR|nr:GNAT family N-acetyltransferase [Vibrio aerogenes]SHH66690.1 Spermidine N(1)-acetyltransferase [Vibrio aerogenes CECT 7868]
MEVKIRRAEPSDAKALQELYQGSNAYSGTLQLPHPSLEVWENRLSKIPSDHYVYVALLGDEVIGIIGFEMCSQPRRRHSGYLGMAVKDSVQGKGVGSQLLATVVDLADNWLNIKRLELTVFVDNAQAVHLYKKFGFEIEGEARDFAFRNGEYVNAYHMARVRRCC